MSVDAHERNFLVYPNPITDHVMNVQFARKPEGTYTVKLSSNNGQLLLLKKIEHKGGSDIKMIDLPATITGGHYLVIITNIDLVETSIKVIVH